MGHTCAENDRLVSNLVFSKVLSLHLLSLLRLFLLGPWLPTCTHSKLQVHPVARSLLLQVGRLECRVPCLLACNVTYAETRIWQSSIPC